MSTHAERPGRIEPRPECEVHCDLCLETTLRPTYQEASIWLTRHLDEKHEGWDVPHSKEAAV